MTIEEKIQEKIKKEAEGYGKLAPPFLEGADFVLDNQWISVNDDLPCNHKELTDCECYTTNVIVAGLNTATGRRFRYLYSMRKNKRGEWYWNIPADYSPDEYKITHWMPYPKYPKELNQLTTQN